MVSGPGSVPPIGRGAGDLVDIAVGRAEVGPLVPAGLTVEGTDKAGAGPLELDACRIDVLDHETGDGSGGEMSVLGVAGPEDLDPGTVREPKNGEVRLGVIQGEAPSRSDKTAPAPRTPQFGSPTSPGQERSPGTSCSWWNPRGGLLPATLGQNRAEVIAFCPKVGVGRRRSQAPRSADRERLGKPGHTPSSSVTLHHRHKSDCGSNSGSSCQASIMGCGPGCMQRAG